MDDTLLAAGFLVAFLGVVQFTCGPVGVVAVGVLLFIGGLVLDDAVSSGGETATDRQNCPNCGARNDQHDDLCHYCDAAL